MGATMQNCRPTGVAIADARSDAALVVLAMGGDHGAFGELHGRYARLVASVAHAEMRRGHAAPDADDIVQEVFTTAWSRLGTLREPDRFRPWLLQITRRHVLDHADRSARRPALDADDDDLLHGAAIEPSTCPQQYAELSDLVTRLHDAMGTMTHRDATAITLAIRFGSRPAEIGTALGISSNNAKVVLHRARRRLRSAIDA